MRVIGQYGLSQHLVMNVVVLTFRLLDLETRRV